MTGADMVKRAEKWLGYNGKKFCADYGMPFGSDWCCAFLWDVFRMTGQSKLFCNGLKTAFVPTVQEWCELNLKRVPPSKAKAGDIIIMTWNGTSRNHIGLIRKPTPKGDTVYTIEGNTGNDDNRLSRVMNRERPKSQVYAIYRPEYTKKHTKRYYLRKKAAKVAKRMKALEFKYKASWKDCALSWKGAKKKRTTNCSTYVTYCLQLRGILKAGQYFWINGDNIVCIGKGTRKALKKAAIIKHPHKRPKKAGLKKGDIVGYKNNAHTMIFAGFNKAGIPKWYSTGGQKDINKGKAHIKPSYTLKKIDTIIRLK